VTAGQSNFKIWHVHRTYCGLSCRECDHDIKSQRNPKCGHHLRQTLFLQPFGTMATHRLRVPNVKFRVLIIGRANAGKTSILQKVCDTTESPEVYRVDRWGTRIPVRLCSCGYFRFHRLVRLHLTLQQRFGRLIIIDEVKDDRENPACSVANTTSTTNSSSRTMMATFSTTHVDLRRAVKTS
jgi:hypothetical protein